ncbi:MAG: LPXTG cell wall anchor domain-containing protein, partial [Anaerovoracaceae bacterium]
VTPVVPDTPVVPVPPVVEPVDPAKPDPTVEPAKPDTPVDGDETQTTNLKTDTENNKSNSPQTGDNTNPWTWMILFGMSGIGLGSILINKKRNTNR